MHDFLFFRRMITPILIQLLFWAAIIACVVGAVINFYQHHWMDGLQTLILGPIFARVGAEFFILFFRINETLTDIRNSLRK